MTKVLHLHQMIDILSELAENEGKKSFIGRVALQGLEDTERVLRATNKVLIDFEKHDIALAEDCLNSSDKKIHNEIIYNTDELKKLKDEIIESTEHLYEYAENNNDIVQGVLIDTFTKTKNLLFSSYDILMDVLTENDKHLVNAENLQEMATIASEFDKSGDPLLMKQAAVLDEILLTIGAQKAAVAAAKRAQDEEILRLKSLAENNKEKDPYTSAKIVHDKFNNVSEAKKEISKMKNYRPMEAPLNTRTCPDHPGAQMARVAEHTYQCSLDKNIYNYDSGYTTMKGNNIPGGNISNQTQSLHDRPNEFTSFETRNSKLNPR